MKRAALSGTALVLLLPVLVISAAMGGIGTSVPSPAAVSDIPAEYLELYQSAGAAYGIPWEVLAGVGKVECDHGRSNHPACSQQGAENFAGAGGPMQFLAGTWAAYGVDADGDGHADRWNPVDAVFSAARYLRASGAPRDMTGALFAYNHSFAYVGEVLDWAGRYRAEGRAAPVELGDPAALAHGVLASPGVALLPEAVRDVRSGRVDPRVSGALIALSQEFRLGHVGPLITGHAYYVAGTRQPSNHAVGRAVDIAVIDGMPVSPGNRAARRAALAIAQLPPPLRPTEIGTPFADLGRMPGFFSDRAHQDHIHIGYDRAHQDHIHIGYDR
jgi:hypothetical protein